MPKKALDLGLVDEVLSLADAVRESKVIIVATPVDSLTRLIPQVLDIIDNQTIVMDVGSTKLPVLDLWNNTRIEAGLSPPIRWRVPSIPAPRRLCAVCSGKCCVFSDAEKSDPAAVALCQALYESLGIHLNFLEGAAHDLHVAYVSHISHIASFALALTVLEKEKNEDRIFELASGGFNSTGALSQK